MAYEIKGTVKSVGEVQQISDKFSKRELVIEHGDKYPQVNQFETSGDRNTLLDGIRPGDVVTIQYDLRGRMKRDGNGAWNTLSIWKLTRDSAAPQRQASSGGGSASDDIPFARLK